MKNFFEVIEGRRSVKYYDESVKIPREEILEMLDAANSAPSSVNFQPWRYIVVDTQEGKEKLAQANYNKTQNDTSAAMIILLADINYEEKFEDIYGSMVEEGLMPEEIKNSIKENMIDKVLKNIPLEAKRLTAYYDCGLWSMQFANVAHAKGYDTNIIGGFSKSKTAELFELDEHLEPVMLISLGKKAKDGRKTTRMSAEDLVRFE